jgi:hypothetical protein
MSLPSQLSLKKRDKGVVLVKRTEDQNKKEMNDSSDFGMIGNIFFDKREEDILV